MKALNEDQLSQLNEILRILPEIYPGCSINVESTDDSISIEVKENTELEEFVDYLEKIDDDLFVEVCETLGTEKINQIQECLNSSERDTVLSGMLLFKNTLSKVLKNKIKYYQECWNNLCS